MSSIELINPKAESVRRAAALQARFILLKAYFDMADSILGQYDGRNGLSQRCEGESRSNSSVRVYG